MLLVSGYTFYKYRARALKIHWKCSTNHKNVKFAISEKGRALIIVAGYRFFKYRTSGSKIYWGCLTHNTHGCRAVIHTLHDMTILKCHNEHNH
ncbi:Modifier of mdg4 [Operophtera brumata]|uniref:Modifier of mdg4 n=1 Tax=Operophtera brumata TaxID=104452 RepID=A0A0L7KVY3_OPEBR|nr:Modifier of mdg4 [Operophtera brumata]